jgi:long-chain fatty acid transport protein
MRTKHLLSLGLVLCSASASGGALASGFSTARFGGEHGNPITTNPTAIYYNPAGLGDSEGIHIFLDANIAFRGATFTHTPAPTDTPEPAGAEGANTDQATLFNVLAAPMVGASAKFGDFAIGAGFFVPIGGAAVWDQNDKFKDDPKYPGTVDGGQRWYSIEGTIRTLSFTGSVAYQIPNTGLSLGVSGNLLRSEIHTLRARKADGTNDISEEGRSLVDVGNWAGSFGAGAMLEALPDKLWFGLSYQSRPNVAGGMTLGGTLTNYFGGDNAPLDIEVHQDLPDIVRLGARFRPTSDIELRLFGDWTRWSALDNQCLSSKGKPCEVDDRGISSAPLAEQPLQNLNRDWHDAFGVRVGGSYWVSPKIEVFSGLGYDSNAIPDRTLDPSLTDFDDISAALGGRIQIGDHIHAALSYTHFFYIPRDTSGESTNDDYLPEQAYSRGPDAGGKYTQWVGAVNVNLEANF